MYLPHIDTKFNQRRNLIMYAQPVSQIVNSDMIVVQSLKSYLEHLQRDYPTRDITPEQMVILKEHARNQLYSDIVQRVPRIASYIMHADLDRDDKAQGLFTSLYNHCMDPEFTKLLRMYLDRNHNRDDNCIVGAFLVKVFTTYLEKEQENVAATKTEDTKGKKTEKVEPEKMNAEVFATVNHIHDLAMYLLEDISKVVRVKCGNLDNNPGALLAIAACVAMNNGDSIKEIINMDLPVLADVFDILNDPSNIIRGALLMKKDDYIKTTKNQEEFITSLKHWVYNKLNIITTHQSFEFLVSVYGSIKPNVKDYLIQIKDCGTRYSNLLIVAKQLINQ